MNTGDSTDPDPPQDPRCGGLENAEIPREHCDVADVADRNRGDGGHGVNGHDADGLADRALALLRDGSAHERNLAGALGLDVAATRELLAGIPGARRVGDGSRWSYEASP